MKIDILMTLDTDLYFRINYWEKEMYIWMVWIGKKDIDNLLIRHTHHIHEGVTN